VVLKLFPKEIKRYFSEMNFLQLKISVIAALLGTFIFTSCGSVKLGGFQYQKFTNLKHLSSNYNDDVAVYSLNLSEIVEDTLLSDSKCDTIYRTTGQQIICIILSQDGDNIKFTDCPPSSSTYELPKSKIDGSIKHFQVEPDQECEVIFLGNGDSVVGHITAQSDNFLKYKECDSDSILTYQFEEKPEVVNNDINNVSKEWKPKRLFMVGLGFLIVGGFFVFLGFATSPFLGQEPTPFYSKALSVTGLALFATGGVLIISAIVRGIKKRK
jgi:hypothetical protein